MKLDARFTVAKADARCVDCGGRILDDDEDEADEGIIAVARRVLERYPEARKEFEAEVLRMYEEG